MQVGFGGTQAAPVALQAAQQAPVRRVADQETHRPVRETDEADLRRHDEVERRSDDRPRASEDDGDSRRVEDEGRRVDIRV